jgi:hypothetical protein
MKDKNNLGTKITENYTKMNVPSLIRMLRYLQLYTYLNPKKLIIQQVQSEMVYWNQFNLLSH